MVGITNPFASKPKAVTEVSELRIYPIKSCRGIKVDSTHLTHQGLEFDRQWMFADADGHLKKESRNQFITIRQVAELTLIDTAIVKGEDGQDHLQISIRNTDKKVTVPARPTKDWLEQNATLEPCKIWSSDTDGWVYNDEINSVFRDHLATGDRRAVLVYKGPTARIAAGNASKQWLGRESFVNFPDVMPLQIANEASLHELNQRLEKKGVFDGDITIERFRPNIIVKGADSPSVSASLDPTLLPTAWSEDNWKTVRIINNPTASALSTYLTANALDIDVQAKCARCQVPNVNPDTAEKHPKEPWDTLVSYRRVDEGIKYKPCFGMLSVPRNEGPIAVGMRFEVTETTTEHKYEKGF